MDLNIYGRRPIMRFRKPMTRVGSLLLLAFCIQCLAGAQESKTAPAKTGDGKTEEKPKEAPFKFSAWCAFRDYLDVQKPPPEPHADPLRNDQSRPGAGLWGGFARHGKWISMVVELQNTTEKDPFDGTMRIRLDPTPESTETGEKPYTTRYRQEFKLPPQTTKRFNFSLLCPEYVFSQIEVNITANGRTYTRYVTLTDLDANPKRPEELVVVVSEESGAFRFLLSKTKSNPDGFDEDGQNRRVAVVRPEDLPSRWHDLTLANLIIIDNPPREGFSDAQLGALEAYCQAGGHLLIGAGKDATRLGPSEGQSRGLADLAGVRINGTARIGQIDLLAPSYKGAGENWELPIVDASVKPGIEPVFITKNSGKEGYIEKVERVVGLGSVTLLPFSLSDDQLTAWPGRQQLPLYILENSVRPHLFAYEDPNLEKVMGRGMWGLPEEQDATGPDRGTLFKLRKDVDESYTRDTPVETQSKPFVASFLLLFLLCAVPGNYLIFGWFKRREIAWLAVPLWALGFSLAAYFIGYWGKVGKLTVNQLCVVQAGPGQPMGVARTFMGIYSPRRGEYELQFKDHNDPAERVQAAPGHLIRDLRTRGITDVLPELNLADHGGPLTVEGLLVQARATRRLEVNHRVDLNDGIHAALVRKPQPGGGNVYYLSVRNGATRQLIGAALLHRFAGGLRAVELGNLDPRMAEPRTWDLPDKDVAPWKDPAEAFFKDAPKFQHARGPDATERGRAVLEFLRTRAEGVGETVIVGWFDGGVLPVEVDGEAPGSSRGMTLVVVPFPEQTARGSARADRSRRVLVSHEFDVIPNTQDWKPLAKEQKAVLLAMRGHEDGAVSFRTGLSADEVKASTPRKVQVQLRLHSLASEDMSSVNSVTSDYEGVLAVEIQERTGNQTRWTQMARANKAPADVPFKVRSGESGPVATFEYPFSPSVAVGRNVTVKVWVKRLKGNGRADENNVMWSLVVEDFKLDLLEIAKPNVEK